MVTSGTEMKCLLLLLWLCDQSSLTFWCLQSAWKEKEGKRIRKGNRNREEDSKKRHEKEEDRWVQMKGVSLFFSIWQSDQEDERKAWFSPLFCCPGKRITSEERMQGFLSMKKQDEKRCISDTSFNFRSEKKKKYHLKIHFWTGWITWRVYSSQDSFFFFFPSFCIPRDNTSSWLVSFSSWDFCSFLLLFFTSLGQEIPVASPSFLLSPDNKGSSFWFLFISFWV